MKEVVKEELNWAACQLSPRTPAASSCQGDGPLCRTASAVALHCEMWRLSVTVTEDRLCGWKGCLWRWIALDLGVEEVEMKKWGGTCINTYVLYNSEGGGTEAKIIVPMLKAHLPLLWPSGPRRIRHSSICPKDENIILTSFSPYFFETIPTKSFLSSTAAQWWKENSNLVKS